MDTINVQVRFMLETVDPKTGVVTDRFSDALYIPIEEYNQMKPEQIEALKLERYNNHREMIEHPPAPVEQTKEEKLASIEGDLKTIEDNKQQLLALKSDIQSKP